jgi:pimeloyl-ACP methyl ester carboxylesterase
MTTAVEPREHTVEARGIRFHYVEWGDPDAPVIVCVHGLTSMCRIWDRFARPFSERYRVIAVSQRGHGDTSWPEQPDYSTDDYVADLEALVDLWGLDRFVLIGLSMGGMNSMAYTARNPDRVTHLVPVDIPPSVDRSKSPTLEIDRHVAEHGYPTFEDHQAALKVMRLTNQISPDEALLHRLRYQLKPTPDGKWTYKQDPRVSYHWRPRDLWDELPKITCPVLIVRGGRSWVFSEKAANRMQKAFPNAELVTIPESGHTVPEDCPEEFNAAVEAFLARHPVD